MKHTRVSRSLRRRAKPVVLALAASLVAILPSQAAGTNYYWDTGSGTWNTGANWSTNPTGAPAGTVTPTTTSDTATFNGSGVAGSNEVISFTGNGTVGSITFNNTGSTTLQSSSATPLTLNLGASAAAISIASTAGAVTIGSSADPLNISLAGSATFTNASANTFTINNGITNAAAGTLTLAGAGNTTINGNIAPTTGTLGLTDSSTGTVTLAGTNSYTGTTLLSGAGGTLVLKSNQALGTSAAALSITANATTAPVLDIQQDTTAYNTAITGAAGAKATVAIDSTSAVTSGNTAYTLGTLSASAATLNVTLGSAITGTGTGSLIFGTTTLTGAAVFDTAANTSLTLGALGGAFGFTKQDAGTMTLATTSTRTTSAGSTTLTGGRLNLDTAGALNATAATGALGISGGATLALEVAAGATYDVGLTTVSGTGGTIESNVLGGGAGVTQTLGTLSIGTQTLTISKGAGVTSGTAGVTFGATTLTGAATFALNAGTQLTLGAITGPAADSITTSGNGTLTLGAAGTITSGFTVNVGSGTTLNLNNATALGTAVTNLADNGSVSLGAATSLLTLSGNGSVADGGNTVTINNATADTYSGVISGSGGLTKAGVGTLTLSGANTYTGTTSINAGVLDVGSAEIAGTSGPLGDSAASNPGSIAFGGGTLQYSASNNNDYSGRFSTASSQAIKIDTNGQTVTFGTALTSSAGTLTLADTNAAPGTLILNAAETYSGLTTVTAGTLQLGANGSLNSGNALTTGASGVFDLNGKSQTLGTLVNGGLITSSSGASTLTFGSATAYTGTGSFGGNLNIIITGGASNTVSGAFNNSGTITDTSTGGAVVLSGAVGAGVTNITVNASTALTLSGNNTNFDGTVILASGSLNLGSATALGGNGSATGTGGTLSIAAGTSLNSAVSNLVLSTVNAETWGGNFTFTGTNNLDLGTGAITVSTPLTLTVSANTLTVDGAVSGGNGVFDVTKAGSGTLDFTHSITLTGTETDTVNAGTTILAGAITGANGIFSIIKAGAGTLQLNSNATLTANQTISSLAGTEVLDGSIGGSGFGITMAAAGGTLVFGGANTYSGATQLTAGTLRLSGAGSSASSDFTVGPNTVLAFDDSAASGSSATNTTRAKSVSLNGVGATAALTVTATGNVAGNTVDTITNALSSTGGFNTVTLTPNTTTTPFNTQLDAGSFSRSAGSLTLFRGTNLGLNSLASNTAGATNIKFATAPTLLGVSGGSGTTVGVVAGAYGDISASGPGATTGGLMTYDSTSGLRLLTANEYTSAIVDGQTTLNNVLYSATATSGQLTTNLTSANTTINSLSLIESGAQQTTSQSITISGSAGSTLNVSSGMIYASQSMSSANNTAGYQLISVPTLNFGSTEGEIIDAQTNGISNSFFSGGLDITSAITGTGGLTLGGSGYIQLAGANNTYTGGTTFDGPGNLILAAGGTIAAGNFVINGGTVHAAVNNPFTGGTTGTNVTLNGGTLTGQNGNGGNAATFSMNNYTQNGGSYSSGSGGHGGGMNIAGTMTLNAGTYSLVNTSVDTVTGLATIDGGTISTASSSDTIASGRYNSGLVLNGGLAISNIASGAYTPITIGAGNSGDTGATMVLGSNTSLTFTGNSNTNTVTILAYTGAGGSGVIQLNGTNTFNIGDGAAAVDLTISAPIINGSTTGALSKTGAGTLLLTGAASTYDGGTSLSAGTLDISGAATLGDSNMANVIAGLSVSGGTLDLGGTTQVVDSVNVTAASTIQNGSLEAASEYGDPAYTVSNATGTVTIAANLLETPTPAYGGNNTLTKSGAGTLILSGANSYTGATTINAGTVQVTGSTASGSAVAVNGGTLIVTGSVGGTVNVASGATLSGAGNGTTTGITGAVTVASGGNINLQDGAIGKLTVGGLTTIGGAGGALTFEIGANTVGSIDQIADSVSGTLSIGSGTALTIVNLGGGTSGQTLALGSYTLMTYSGAATGLGNLSLSSTTLDGDTLSLSTSTAGQVNLIVTSGGVSDTGTDYFNGTGSDLTQASAYDTGLNTGTATPAAPSSSSNLFFSATRNSSVTAGTINSNTEVNSVNFGTGGTKSFAISGTGVITIDAKAVNGNTAGSGITVASGGGIASISNAIALGGSQTWSDASSNTLTVSGGVTGTGNLALQANSTGAIALSGGSVNNLGSITNSGTGSGTTTISSVIGTNVTSLTQNSATSTLVLSGANTYSGGTSVTAGTLMMTNGVTGSATGSGALTVGTSGTLGGVGRSASTSFNISGHVTAGSGLASDTTGATTLIGGATLHNSTFANATLSFNLNSANRNSTSINVAGTGVDFGATTMSLTLQGSTPIGAFTPYVLISGANSSSLAGVDGSQYSGFTTDASGADGLLSGQYKITSGLSLNFTNDDNFYSANSFLFLNTVGGVDDIEVEVVPEPSTWALMLGGLALLIVIQRRRNKVG